MRELKMRELFTSGSEKGCFCEKKGNLRNTLADFSAINVRQPIEKIFPQRSSCEELGDQREFCNN
jgi:hypothetical protein